MVSLASCNLINNAFLATPFRGHAALTIAFIQPLASIP
jgi:hypothetical protein